MLFETLAVVLKTSSKGCGMPFFVTKFGKREKHVNLKHVILFKESITESF